MAPASDIKNPDTQTVILTKAGSMVLADSNRDRLDAPGLVHVLRRRSPAINRKHSSGIIARVRRTKSRTSTRDSTSRCQDRHHVTQPSVLPPLLNAINPWAEHKLNKAVQTGATTIKCTEGHYCITGCSETSRITS